jgi:hypothetical protein
VIDLDIPKTIATPFVIATAQPLQDPASIARARVRQPLAAGLLNSSLVQICTLPAAESGYSDLMESAAWVRSEDRRLLRKLTHHTVVMGHVPPVSQPDHGQAIRAIARVIAEACDGIVFDGWSHQVLPHDFRFGTEHPEFCLADDWLAMFISASDAPDRPSNLRDADHAGISDRAVTSDRAGAPGSAGLSDRARPSGRVGISGRAVTSNRAGASDCAGSSDRTDGLRRLDDPHPTGGFDHLGRTDRGNTSGHAGGGLHLVTAGMHRFALPEIEATRVPIGNVFAAITLLRCLAVTFLEEHWDWLACNPGARSRRLPHHAWVEPRDVWRYWAAEPKDAIAGRVRVRLDCTGEDGPDGFPYLSVGPPTDFGAPIAEWWNDVVDLAMPYVSKAPRRTAA